jgi:hypothetical protein
MTSSVVNDLASKVQELGIHNEASHFVNQTQHQEIQGGQQSRLKLTIGISHLAPPTQEKNTINK